ncbi:EamA family transporter [Andreprevotia chitinilytica]|uniref:EamA family transporter n=1 Tax=Andreprevotia chitinilytica TaxID=396808 RepID=UPI000552FC64|nr:EamA family transporter [Andreprevotia chitinilytica]
MESWVLYALLSAGFAGLVAVSAKIGLANISGDLALGIRTGVIFILVAFNTVLGRHYVEADKLSGREWGFLVFSGAATMLSWLFYYRAVKLGPVSGVALIDKSSVLITLLLSFLVLGEPLSWRVAVGGALIVGGFLVLTLK